MLQQIADLIEFDIQRFSRDQIIQEFHHKFSNTYLKINGKYHVIRELIYKNGIFNLLTFTVEGNDFSFTQINIIEKVLPKTGLYSSKHGLLYLYRLPKRQWLKSLSKGNNYQTLILHRYTPLTQPTITNTVFSPDHLYAKESIIHEKDIWLHWIKVGKVKEDTIFVQKEHFLEEIKELWNQQFQIILDVKHHKQKEDDLQVDF